jgi:DNA-binding transcriptional regulator YdaS (Cro superfamily)
MIDDHGLEGSTLLLEVVAEVRIRQWAGWREVKVASCAVIENLGSGSLKAILRSHIDWERSIRHIRSFDFALLL